jgi:hypothetical protein
VSRGLASREGGVHTGCVVAASGERNDFGTDCSALLGNVGLADILSSDESCERCGDGESLEMHIDWRDNLFYGVVRQRMFVMGWLLMVCASDFGSATPANLYLRKTHNDMTVRSQNLGCQDRSRIGKAES